jgi:colicin import membrane protein
MQKRNRKKNTGISFLLSLMINAGILFLLAGGVVGYAFKKSSQKTPPAHEKIVRAVAVDQQTVTREIQAIKTQRANARQAKNASNQRDAAKKTLSSLEQKQQQIRTQSAKETLAATQRLNRLEILQQQAKQQLAALKTQQEKLTQTNQTIETQLQKTRAALKQQMSTAKKAKLQATLSKEKAKQRALQQAQFNNKISRYKTLIQNEIARQWLIPDGINQNLSCQLLLTLDAKGRVLSVNITRSSGNEVLDRSAVTAVLKASPLSVPTSTQLFKQFQSLSLTIKPEGIISQ